MRTSAIFLMVLTILTLPGAALAAWSPAGNPVSLAANDQIFPRMVADGAGGAIFTWQDSRGTNVDIYVQRLNAAGLPQWTPDGVALCTAAGDQLEPKIASDGAGGAIVTWYDFRGGATSDIYAQRVDASGVPQWTPDGVVLCAATTDQFPTGIVSDGAGGAIVPWHDLRSGANYDIYVQRVDAAGIPQWTLDGLNLCNAASNQTHPMIASDDAGGAIVTWEDGRGGGNNDIYAQRVNPTGVPQWLANGVLLCGLSAGQITPTIAADGAGGAVVTWFDGRSGARGIYVQRVSNLGAPQWTADGVALKTAATNQAGSPEIVSDGAGGAIVTWYDYRSGTNDIYARRVNSAGVAQWAPNGVALCTAADAQYFPRLVPDGAGGAIVTWSDYRSGTILDVYAQRVSDLGVPQWLGDGVLVEISGGDQVDPGLVSDGTGGAIFAWYDYRNGPTGDIYAQHMNGSGAVPTAVSGPAHSPSLVASEVYPNPFSATAWMDVHIATPSALQVDVFDVAGRRVRTMTLGRVTSRRIEFDGRDHAGALLPSGVYFYRVNAAGETITRKMVIVR